MEDSSKTVVNVEGVTQKKVYLSLGEVFLLLHRVTLTAKVRSEVGGNRCCVASVLKVLVEANNLGYS